MIDNQNNARDKKAVLIKPNQNFFFNSKESILNMGKIRIIPLFDIAYNMTKCYIFVSSYHNHVS